MRAGRVLLFVTLLGLGTTLAFGQSARAIGIYHEDAPASPLRIGRQYLVVIAISDYSRWPSLASPVRDAREIRDILVSRYRFDQTYELYDEQASKANIIRLLARLQTEVEADDALLILYAGHGHLDTKSNTGFWIPVNAGTEVYEQENWLPHTQLRGLLANIPANHLFVISDSCFAGDLIQATRSLPDAAGEEYFQRAYSRVCRQVLTSGATEAVPDVSDFAARLKSILRRNQNPLLDTFSLYNEIRLGAGSIVPLLGSLAGTGHQEGSSFLLFLRPGLDQPPAEPAGPRPGEPAKADGPPPDQGDFSAALGAGPAFPVGEAAAAIRTAPLLWCRAHHNLSLGWGRLGVGVLAGVLRLSTGSGLDYSYQITAFPVAAELRYQTLRERPLCLSAAVALGLAPSRISLPAEEKPAGIAKFLLAASLGIGSPRFGRFRLRAEGSYLLILFDHHPFQAIAPEIRVEYAF